VVVNPGVQAVVVVEADVGRGRRFELSEAREGPASDPLDLQGVEERLNDSMLAVAIFTAVTLNSWL
jgi:hypothetical protein